MGGHGQQRPVNPGLEQPGSGATSGPAADDKRAWCFTGPSNWTGAYDADPYSNRGNIYLREGLCELAVRDYDRAIALAASP